MEHKLDIICRRLRDIGVFFIGVAAVVFTTYFIWSQTHSPEREIQAAIQKSFAEGLNHQDKK